MPRTSGSRDGGLSLIGSKRLTWPCCGRIVEQLNVDLDPLISPSCNSIPLKEALWNVTLLNRWCMIYVFICYTAFMDDADCMNAESSTLKRTSR